MFMLRICSALKIYENDERVIANRIESQIKNIIIIIIITTMKIMYRPGIVN
jgi:hypothetical protein